MQFFVAAFYWRIWESSFLYFNDCMQTAEPEFVFTAIFQTNPEWEVMFIIFPSSVNSSQLSLWDRIMPVLFTQSNLAHGDDFVPLSEDPRSEFFSIDWTIVCECLTYVCRSRMDIWIFNQRPFWTPVHRNHLTSSNRVSESYRLYRFSVLTWRHVQMHVLYKCAVVLLLTAYFPSSRCEMLL